MVRKNGCQVLDSLAELLNKSSGSEGNELKKKVGALVKVSSRHCQQCTFQTSLKFSIHRG